MKKDVLTATAEVREKVHTYMRCHPESELHQQGKMFGVLVVESQESKEKSILAAFSAKLDGSYYHEGFVPPVYDIPTPPIGINKEESRRLQQLLFANYSFVNGHGETKNLLDIFANEKPIIFPEQWFDRDQKSKAKSQKNNLPPSGAGECCAPKLLQYALTHGLKPLELAEFWIGAPSRTEIRREGVFYAPCSGKCMPILKHMLQGLNDLKIHNLRRQNDNLKEQIKILYEDEYLMVINKPAGLLSVQGKNDEPSVETYLNAKPVHRLDQDTSGLLVLAKTPEIYKTLQSYFQRRDIKKRYEAIIQGDGTNTLADEGMIDLPLLPNPYDRPRQMVNIEHGKTAITKYRVRERRSDGSILIDLYPLTGRTHQLRVHASHPDGLNAPIQGDRLYGGLPADRLMLHAAEITFIHPIYLSELSFCDSSSSSSW